MSLGPVPLEAGRQLLDEGRLEFAHGRPRRSEQRLKRALAAVPDTPLAADAAHLRAEVLISLAFCEFELHGIDAASSRLDSAGELISAHRLMTLWPTMRNQRGIFLSRRGLLHEALVEFDAGVAVADDGAAQDRCALLVNRATVQMGLGAVSAARGDLETSVRTAAEAGLTLVELKSIHNLGYAEFLAGNLPRALTLMEEAFTRDPTVSPGVALLDKSSVLVEAGLLGEAEATLGEAATIFAEQRLGLDLAEAELERARCAIALGDRSGAREFARAARTRFGRRGNAARRRAAELVMLQAEVGGRGARQVVGRARLLRAELEAAGLRLPARAAALVAAEALVIVGETDAAAAVLADVGPSPPDDPITGRMQSRYIRASVDASAGRAGPATREVRRALRELADYQASFGSIDLRTASAVHGQRLVQLDVRLALRSGRTARVFDAVERGRAVSGRLPTVRPPADPVAADLLAELRQTLDELRSVEQDRDASAPLLARRRELEHRIVARTWQRSGSGAALHAVGLDRVASSPHRAGRTFVTYFQSDGRLWALSVGDRNRMHDLGPVAPVVENIRRARADLDVLARPALPGGIRGSVRASLQRSLTGLDAALIYPLRLDGAPLVLVSTGTLGQLPWSSLPSLRGVPIVVAPSATKWLDCADRGVLAGLPPAKHSPIVVVAGPDLARAESEAAAVAAPWPGSRTVTGAGATRETFASLLGSARVLHVAAHGVHHADNPLFSALRMADGPIFAHELDQTASAPEHVILSACEVGLATVRPGDEALGFASVLLQLGTRSVVAGLARVGDDLAAQTMQRYHVGLAGGADSATALSAALVEVDADVVPPFVTFGAAWSADGTGFGSASTGRVPLISVPPEDRWSSRAHT